MGLKSYPRAYFELMIAGFSVVMAVGLTKAFLPIMASNLDPTGILVGFATSSWFLFRAFVEIPSGLVLVKIGRRNMLVIGLFLSVVSSIACAYSNNIYILILGMAIWGLGTALFLICSTVTLFDLFELNRRGKALGTFQGIEFIGSFIGAPIGAVLAASTGFSSAFLLASLMIFSGLLVTFGSRDIKRLDLKFNANSEFRSLKSTIREVKNLGLIAISLVNMAKMAVTQGIMYTVFQLYLNSQLSMSLEAIGLILGARTGGYICTTLVSGHAAEKLGRKPLIVVNLVIEASCLYLYTMASNFEQVLILAIISGLASGFTYANLVVLLSELVSPSTRSVAVGMYRTFMDIGGILGPIMFMLLYTSFNSSVAFVSAAFIFLVCVGLVFLVKTNPHHASQPTQ